MKNVNRLSKRLWMAGILLPFIAAASCTLGEEYAFSHEGGETEITFSILLPGKGSPGGGAGMRALTEAGENDVQAMDILVFHPDGEYVYTARCNGSAISTDGANTRKKNFTVKLRQGTFDLVLLANARAMADHPFDGLGKAQALALIEAGMPASGKWPADGSRPIPMWGEKAGVPISDATDLTGGNAVKMTRMVARVDVQVTAANFLLSSVRVYNYNTKGSIAPAAGQWDATSYPDAPRATAPNVPSSSVLTQGPAVYDNADGKTEVNTIDNRCTSEIYLFEAENHAGEGHAAPRGLLERTCLVVGGVFDANGDGNFANDGGATYYRVDFSTGQGVSQSYLDVLRNHWYTFSINAVSGAGYGTPQEAFESLPVNIEADVLEWNDAGIGDVIFDGQYHLSVKPAGLSMNFYKDADQQEAAVRTDVLTGWVIAKITELAFDGITENDIAPGGWLSTNISQGAASDVYVPFNVIVTENPSLTDQRIGYVYIKAGRLQIRITVTQGTTAKKTPVFNFVEYANLANPGQISLPIEGGIITATAETNIGWTLKTNITGISASYSEPESYAVNPISLSITIPRLDSWNSITIEVWLESEYYYPGQKLFPTVFTQSSYSINYISTTCPDVVPPAGGIYDIVFTGECPDFKVRTIASESGEVVLWESLPGSIGSRQVSIPSFTSATDRTLSIQYEQNGSWITAKTVTQKGQVTMVVGTPRSFYILNGGQHSLAVSSNVGWRVEITEDTSLILAGLTNSSGNSNGNFTFTMVNDVQSGAIVSGMAKLTVYPDVPGMFSPIELTINGLLYFNTGSGLYFWTEDFTNSTWYVYANVPENLNENGHTPYDGTQSNPPRAGSCADIDPANPMRWRLPDRDEMQIVGNYAATNGGAAAFGFAIGATYWGRRSLTGTTGAPYADYVGIWTNNTTWTRSSDGNGLKTITTNRARCISSSY